MIDGEIIRFGSGDIAVGSGFDMFGRLCFHQIKPPQEVGVRVTSGEVEYIGNPIVFEGYEEISELAQKAKRVKSGEMLTFECFGYIFDFSEGDPRSIDVVIKHADRALNQLVQLLAC